MHFNIYTPSYNKPQLVAEAIGSVFNQTYKDFTYWVVENSTDIRAQLHILDLLSNYNDDRLITILENPDRTQKKYWSSVFMNKYLDYMDGLIIWLSDDDLLKPNCLQRVVEEFNRHPEANVVYWSMITQIWNGSTFVDVHTRNADRIIEMGTNVDCMIDGGVIAYRSSILKNLTKPYWREIMDNDAAHCDGIFMNRLVEKNKFYPINEVLSIKRTGPESQFTKK